MFRSRSWFGGGWGRPKNPHSLERLKYLHNILSKNTTVSEGNRSTLVESLRCIAEILIWGDQNDSSVFDFFLEKNMLSYFLKIMRQKCGGSSYVCVQLLQTLNILFENIRNETSLYYLLSNNHVNSIIVHKFDFSDEEVMAYYISFLKTLSLKLNNHTIHFFYNEHTKDFPLYTEAIKFFNHPESMVRIAVRTLTLNVYRVQDASMLRFIRDRTAAPYFSNLVWFIGKHILELDACVRNDADHQSHQKLECLVAEHLDHLHYINDILCLNIPDLNDVLTEHLLHKLLVPLYIYSLTSESVKRSVTSSPYNKDHIQSIEAITRNLEAILKGKSTDSPVLAYQRHRMEDEESKPSVSCVVSLFLLSQVFLIITHGPIIHGLAWILLQSDLSVFEDGATKILEMYISNAKSNVKLEFSKPQLSLEKALENSSGCERDYTTPEYSGAKAFGYDTDQSSCDLDPELVSTSLPSTSHISDSSSIANDSTEDLLTDIHSAKSIVTIKENMPDSPLPDSGVESSSSKLELNITDEEKQKLLSVTAITSSDKEKVTLEYILETENKEIEKRPFLKTIFDSLDCFENDYKALFALCLLFALINNKGVNTELLDTLLCPEIDDSIRKRSVSTGSTASQGDRETNEDRTTSSTPSIRGLHSFNALLISKLLAIANLSCKPASKVRLVTLELSVTLARVAMQGASGVAGDRHVAAADALRQRAAALARNFYKCDDIFLDMFEDEYCEMSKRPLNVEWLCMDAAILLPPTRTPMSGIAFAKRLPSGEGFYTSQMERARRAIRTFFLIRDLYLKLTGKPETQLPLTNPAPFVQVGDVLDLNDSDLISCDIIQKDGTWHHRFLAVDNIQIILVEPDKQRLGWGVAKLVGSLQDLEIQGDKDDPRCLHLTIHKPRVGASGALPRTVLLRAKFKFDDHIRSMAAKQRLTKGRTKSRQKKMHQIGRLLEVSGITAPALAPRHRPLFARPGLSAIRRSSGESDDTDRRLRRPSGHMLKDGIVVYRERTTSRESSVSRSSSTHGSREGSPRLRSEEIPLEDIKRLNNVTATPSTATVLSQPSTSSQKKPPVIVKEKSEETSFISGESRPKRKGAVETI
ncbi:protein CLEC16A homolog isoform X2 [Hyposmocoma kahamanoa]|uniref:protein CLEC16A homolog isoform X2 n=1 Tax=Hyposmocoma kahamanoa TaxID=1477025 RepID=UPI000E6D7663|nr:protein CLEC16A homolog isoform X2 [Hyposmocoma kahamanoa]